MTSLPPPQRVVIATHPEMPEAEALARRITDHLDGRGTAASFGSLYNEDLRARVRGGEFDLLVALGGDGTMLRAGHLCAPVGLPILGVNLGRFGFLIEVGLEDWQGALDRVLQGDYWLERRMMLRVEHLHAGRAVSDWEVLNECVIGRGEMVRPVELVAEIDGRYLTTYIADALIVATATGSTAYALAAGGPILPPELRNILMIPVAAHLTIERAFVLDEGSRVRVTVHTDHEATLSADGQVPVRLESGDQVEVRAGEHTALFVRIQDRGYFYPHITSRMSRGAIPGEAR
ncbi:MAG: NAD(+)/NADH kinase [Chloroflexota bacterium]